MLRIDTSLWIHIYRDPTGAASQRLQSAIGSEEFVFCQSSAQSCCKAAETSESGARTLEYLDDQSYLEMSTGGWTEAARIHFELRQRGLTVRSTLDCCVAVVAIEHDLTVLHNERDYETIATVRPLKQQRVQLAPSP